MNRSIFTLESCKHLTRDVYEMHFCGDTSAITASGQFVNIEIGDQYLRRPISICDYSDGELTLICRAIGSGTTKLCTAPLGTQFDMLCGLGNGYDIEKSTAHPILMGGGVGVPPLYALAKKLIAQGITPHVALGFASKDDCFYEAEFKALGCPTFVSTVDGSCGEKGFVTSLAEAHAPACDYVFTCGPLPMLKAIYQMPQLSGGQFSFEERMGCGFGGCMGCSTKTNSGNKRICLEGPVLNMEDIIW